MFSISVYGIHFLIPLHRNANGMIFAYTDETQNGSIFAS